jgi:hypothetical protein
MRIAQVAPLYESVPPLLYGGTERVVSWLTEELVRRGHDVTLFASRDSRTMARLVAPCERAVRLDTAPMVSPFTCSRSRKRWRRPRALMSFIATWSLWRSLSGDWLAAPPFTRCTVGSTGIIW